jgi:hypothetical protein
MFFSYFTLFVVLSVSAIAAWYSIIGLTAIFAAAVIPIIIMGGALEVAKITATIWLHEFWDRCRWLMKVYLVSAVIILMIITSMGIFGFLSRAHIEQSAPIGDTAAQIEIIDSRIAVEQEVIEQYRRDLAILNQQIERFSELGAVTRGVNARAAQQEERQAIFDRIEQSQQAISDLRQQRAPLAADIRKIETEVGPIKYIAALIYGDNPDQNLLEKAVRWVIILLVVVFDPLAIMLVLAATESIKWNREKKAAAVVAQPNDEFNNHALTDDELEEIEAAVDELNQSQAPKSILEQHPYLSKEFVHFKDIKPMTAPTATPAPVFVDDEQLFEELPGEPEAVEQEEPHANVSTTTDSAQDLDQHTAGDVAESTVVAAPPVGNVDYGDQLPLAAEKGDQFILTSAVPTVLYKHNGIKWVSIDKNKSDSYTYNSAYIDYLVQKIATGEYDPEWLTDGERVQIEFKLRTDTQ